MILVSSLSIQFTSRSPLVHTEGTLSSVHSISGVLRPVALYLIRALRNPTFHKDNARPHVASIARTFLVTLNFPLLSWASHSPDLSPIENVWSMVAKQLTHRHAPITTINELWHHVEATWASVTAHAIQFLFDSMPRDISTLITARGGCSGY
ncbi:transposable element Tcb1 transposase [Trichonephila clavipes]|nr:transposable element Tcb1 transposase [Trichonephila clavipes]